ncbi:MAG: transcription termination factor NusA [Candidatus Delongbacteria bacterium]|nr:transcription termination factor NusA [Candidatus Delongbacteria bacterium]MBN2835672.1 transcription termination factor NusA [Candidatus Delongbacteria bacterium]
MDTREVVQAIEVLLKEKNIDRDKLGDIIESVFKTMIKKKFNIEEEEEVDESFSITFNIAHGDVEIIHERVVVADEDFVDEVKEVPYSEAVKIDDEIEIGEELPETVEFSEFGRRHIIAAKQNLIQKIRQVEKGILYDNYKDKIGEIITGQIHQTTAKEIKIHFEGEELTLPKSEWVFNERYRRGELIKVVIKDVIRKNHDVKIVVSRADKRFIKRLFETEVPEISDGIINIVDIARRPGIRTKIVIESIDSRVDPVGACVGQRGSRISAIVSELNKEKVDIIHFIREPRMYLTRLLGIKTEYELDLDESTRSAEVIVMDQLVKDVLGVKNSNVELVEELSGYTVKVISESEFEAANNIKVKDVEEFSNELIDFLELNDLSTAQDIFDKTKDELLDIEGMDDEKIEFILKTLNAYYGE